jgi:hypothetical protein
MTVLTNAMKSGRMSDVYSPKPAFVSGTMILALTHLGAGFVQQKSLCSSSVLWVDLEAH